MDGKVLTQDTKKLLVELCDGAVKGNEISKNPIIAGSIELVDGPAFKMLIDYGDAMADKIIPDDLDPKINEACRLALDGQYEEAAGVAGEVIDQLVDLEKVDDSIEHLVFVDGLKFAVRNLQLYIENKKKENSTE